MSKVFLLCLVASGGCASHLQVFDSERHPLPGVPVPTSVLYTKSGTYQRLVKGGECEPTQFSEQVSEPNGPPIYVNVSPAQLAKTGFDVKLQSNGSLQEVSLNTEPVASDIIKSTAEAIKTVAPLLGLAAASVPPQALVKPPCDSAPDPTTLSFRKFLPE